MGGIITKIKTIQTVRRAVKLLVISLILICLANALFIPPVHAAGIGQAVLTVKQVFTDDSSSVPQNKTFTYQLTPKISSNPMPSGSEGTGYTFTVTGTDNVSLVSINFSKAGTYIYELSCITNAETGYAIDKQVYTIEIYITNDLTPISIVYISNGNKASEIVFKHSYVNLPENTVKISGSKTWNYGNAPESDRPDRITVFIKNGDKTVKEITVTAANGWKWSAQLPKTDASGAPVNYTVDEANVPHYTHVTDGYNLVNTYVSSNYPGDSSETYDVRLHISKSLKNELGQLIGEGKKFAVRLYDANGVMIRRSIISANQNEVIEGLESDNTYYLVEEDGSFTRLGYEIRDAGVSTQRAISFYIPELSDNSTIDIYLQVNNCASEEELSNIPDAAVPLAPFIPLDFNDIEIITINPTENTEGPETGDINLFTQGTFILVALSGILIIFTFKRKNV